MPTRRIVSLTRASHDEAVKRIDAVIMPYFDNLDVKHEAGLRSIIADIRVELILEFEGFGFEDIEVK